MLSVLGAGDTAVYRSEHYLCYGGARWDLRVILAQSLKGSDERSNSLNPVTCPLPQPLELESLFPESPVIPLHHHLSSY